MLVILLSALYTFQLRDQWEEPPVTADTDDAALAAGGSQGAQTLSDAKALVESRGAEQLTVPTQAPLRFSQPVSGFADRGFSVTEPQYFSQTGVWQVHPGIDLLVAYGEVVKACGAGTVDAVWEDNQLGLCVRLTHEDGYQSVYAGLSNADYVRAGDPVAQGKPSGTPGTACWPKPTQGRTCTWKSGRMASRLIRSPYFWGLTIKIHCDTLQYVS